MENNTQLYLGKKALYEELRRLGFHHSWGYWISDEDKWFRILIKGRVKHNKGHYTFYLSTRGTHFDFRLTSQKMFSVEDLGIQIFEYYRFKKLNPKVETHCEMKQLPHTIR